MEREAIDSRIAEKERLAHEGMRIAIEALEAAKSRGLDYRIVGGVALSACMGGVYLPLRPNGTIRDVDVIIMNDPDGALSQLKEHLAARARSGIMVPPLEFNMVRDENDVRAFQLLGTLKKLGSNGYALSFREVCMPIPDELLRTERGHFLHAGEKYSFDTFPPATILHLYMKRTASLKHKDVAKVVEFAKSLSRSGQFSFKDEHGPYKVFHDFADAVRERYPLYAGLIQSYNAIDNALFGGLISHRLVPRKIWERIID